MLNSGSKTGFKEFNLSTADYVVWCSRQYIDVSESTEFHVMEWVDYRN